MTNWDYGFVAWHCRQSWRRPRMAGQSKLRTIVVPYHTTTTMVVRYNTNHTIPPYCLACPRKLHGGGTSTTSAPPPHLKLVHTMVSYFIHSVMSFTPSSNIYSTAWPTWRYGMVVGFSGNEKFRFLLTCLVPRFPNMSSQDENIATTKHSLYVRTNVVTIRHNHTNSCSLLIETRPFIGGIL